MFNVLESKIENSPMPAGSNAFSSDAQRWRALLKRDRRADGEFVYSVRTTGIYCRPNCPSRLAAREHIAFHKNYLKAEAAGFRACKRCKPNGPSRHDIDTQRIEAACRTIESSESEPKLAQLAEAAYLSQFHFQRLFKRFVGLTPREYWSTVRNARMRSDLRKSSSVTEAIYKAGFGSSSRFYEGGSPTLGMTPSQFRDGAKALAIEFGIAGCSLGLVLVASTKRGICAVLLGDERAALEKELRAEFPRARIEPGGAAWEELLKEVIRQIDTPDSVKGADLPLDIQGSAFQRRVWQALREIPPGRPVSYTDLAQRLGSPSAVRAVARACATNPVAVVVPCHRVVRRDGQLAGYRWGLERKRKLLAKERADHAGAPGKRRNA